MKNLLVAQSLSFRYPQRNEEILADINIKINPGDFVFLTGPSGCGKSTLAYCLTGFIPYYFHGSFSGAVWVEEQNFSELTLNQISRKIGFVQQNPEDQLVTLNVRDELAFGLENFCYPVEEILKRIEFVTSILDIKHLLNRDTHTLSGGEKQKVSIGSILTLKPKFLILDEPSASLDPPSTKQLYNLLVRLSSEENIGILVIEHRLRFISYAQRILWLEKGKKLEELQENELLRRYSEIKYEKEIFSETKDRKKLLECKQISFSYPSNPVIKNIDLTVNTGEIIGIMGENGAGKTTFLRIIEGLLKSINGSISFNNENITSKDTFERAQQIGLIFQNPNHQIFEKTVWKEILIGPKNFKLPFDIIEPRAINLLDQLGLSSYKDDRPFGLSYGEKRRLNFASIDIYSPPMLLLDEPFTGQDMNNVIKIIDLIYERKKKGLTTILASHDSELIKTFCDRCIFLEKGKIIVNDSTDRFFTELKSLGKIEFVPNTIKECE